jgi:hypothetical protein
MKLDNQQIEYLLTLTADDAFHLHDTHQISTYKEIQEMIHQAVKQELMIAPIPVLQFYAFMSDTYSPF